MEVSIVMPCFNAAKFIEHAIQSVLNQTLKEWELIIIDDASTDNSLDRIIPYVEQYRNIKLLTQQKNAGAAAARNLGIRKAQGRFIAFLDADDIWAPNKLFEQISLMKEKNWAFSYTAYEKINESGKKIGTIGVPLEVTYKQLLKTCTIGCLTAVYDTKILGKIEMPNINKRQDFGLWLKILKRVPVGFGINKTLAYYRVYPTSLSANKKKAALYTWELYRNVEKLPPWSAGYYFSHYALRGILRTKYPYIATKLGFLVEPT